MVTRGGIILLMAVLLGACSSKGKLEGPPQNLHQVATPDPTPVVTVPKAVPPPSLPAPGASPRWRVWVPPQTSPQGEVMTEGHFVYIDLAPPVAPQVVAPAKPMPRQPKEPKAQPKAEAPSTPPAPVADVIPSLPMGVPPAALSKSGAARGGTNRLPQQLPGVPQ